MPTYSKLIKRAAEIVEAAQRELSAAKPPPPPGPFTQAPEALQLYHGSPHEWDTPAFEANLRKGEGALAYGPGGYTTGNRPLAAHYANSLAARSNTARPDRWQWSPSQSRNKFGFSPNQAVPTVPGPLGESHLLLQKMAREDPDAALAWLRAGQFRKARGLGWVEPEPALAADYYASRDGYHKQFFADNADKYDKFERSSLGADDPARYPPVLTANRLALNPKTYKDALDVGRALKGGPFPTFQFAKRAGAPTPGARIVPEDSALTNNFRALARANLEDAGPKYKAGMGAEFALKFGPGWRKRLEAWNSQSLKQVGPPQFLPAEASTGGRPNIYEMGYDAHPNEMLLYDYPVAAQPPLVQGALSALADSAGWGPLAPGTSVSTLLKRLPGDATGMRMLREAGIPATAYLRAGPRAGAAAVPPPVFHPSDYNFVIHNEDLLRDIMRKDKRAGGPV